MNTGIGIVYSGTCLRLAPLSIVVVFSSTTVYFEQDKMTDLAKSLLPRETGPPLIPYSVSTRALKRLDVSPTDDGNFPTASPSWTQSPASRALRNIGAGTTEVIFGSTGSIQSCIMTLASCTIGTGVLALPAAFVEAGFASGLLLMTMSIGVNVWTCLLLCHCCVMSKRYSYRRIGEAAFGKSGGIAVKFGVVFVLFGIITALQVVLSDSLYKVAHLFVNNPASKWTLSAVAIGVTVLPLSLPSSISALRYTSMLALSSIFYVTVVVVLCGVKRIEEVGGLESSIALAQNETGAFWGPQSPESLLNIITNIPVFMMSLACQVQVPDIFHTMPRKLIHDINGSRRERSLYDMKVVVVGALSLVCFLYLLLGVSGAMAFVGHWDKLKGDVLIALGTTTQNKVLLENIDAARVVMCVSVSLTCPLLVLPCRDTLLQLLGLDWSENQNSTDNITGTEAEEAEMENNRKSIANTAPRRASPLGRSHESSQQNQIQQHNSNSNSNSDVSGGNNNLWPFARLLSHAAVTAALLATTWCLANSVNNLKLVLGFTGATGGSLLLYILPAAFYLKLLRGESTVISDEDSIRQTSSCLTLLFGWIPLVLGTTIMIVATSATIYFVKDGTTNTTTIG